MSSAWVYLPQLDGNATWKYAFGDRRDYGAGPINVTLPTPINEFPLFYRERF